MFADVDPNAGVFRLLLHGRQRHRIARRRLLVGGGFVPAGHAVPDTGSQLSVQPVAADYGSNHALAGPSRSAFPRHGPDAGQNHEVYAADVYVVPLQLFRRINPLLDGAKSIDYYSNLSDAECDPSYASTQSSGIDAATKKEEIKSKNQPTRRT